MSEAFDAAWSVIKALPEQKMFVERTLRKNAEYEGYEDYDDNPEIDRYGLKTVRSKWVGGSAECKKCKNWLSFPSSDLKFSNPTLYEEVLQNYKSINQSGMCEECYQKQLNREPQEWPLDDAGYYNRGIDRMRYGRQ